MHLGHADSREDAWKLVEMYAELITDSKLPLAVGLRPSAGGFEVYAVAAPKPPAQRDKDNHPKEGPAK